MSCAGDFHEPVCLRPLFPFRDIFRFPFPCHISISLSAAYLPQGYPCRVLFPFRVTFPSVFSLSAAVFSFRRYSADYSPKSFQPAKLQKKMHICKSSRRKIARKCIFSAGVPAYARIMAGATALKKVIASAIFFCGNTCLNAQHCCTVISEGPFRGVPKLQKKSDICKFLRKIYYFAPHFSFPFPTSLKFIFYAHTIYIHSIYILSVHFSAKIQPHSSLAFPPF